MKPNVMQLENRNLCSGTISIGTYIDVPIYQVDIQQVEFGTQPTNYQVILSSTNTTASTTLING